MTVKRGLSLVFALVLCAALLPMTANAADAPPSSYTAHGYTITVTQLGGQYGYVGPNEEYYSNRYVSDGMVHISDQNGNSGFCDLQGNIVIEPKFNTGNLGLKFHNGLCKLSVLDEWTGIAKWGYMDKKGNIAIEAIYDDVSDFIDGMARVYENGKYYIINTSGAVIADIQTNGFSSQIVYKDGTVAEDIFVNPEALREAREKMKIVTGGGKYGAVDQSGTVVIPYIYNYLSGFSNGLCVASTGVGNDGFGVIDAQGNVIVPFDWSFASEPFSDDGVLIAIWPGNSNQYVLQISGEQSTPSGPTGPSDAPNLDSASDWARDYINEAHGIGLIPPELQSDYTRAATRAEFCALAVALYETVTGTAITDRKTFDDTTDVNVEKMAALGVVNGVGDNRFAPDTGLTREQAATMLSRLADSIGKPLPQQAAAFNDNSSISPWALDAIGQMQATGIMSGVGDNTFAPQSDYTREQSIITMLRLYDAVS